MKIFKKICLVIFVIFYFVAGVNHFRSPDSYYHIIPHYFPFPVLINILSGIAEILFALLAIRPQTRKVACYGIILILTAFIPVHVQMVTDAPFDLGPWVVSPLVAWIRLVVLQPLLILWAWWHSRP